MCASPWRKVCTASSRHWLTSSSIFRSTPDSRGRDSSRRVENTSCFFVKYGVNMQWMDLSPAQSLFKGFKWWKVRCRSVLDASSPVITLTNWTSWFVACRNVLTHLSMPYAVSVGTRQSFWGCQSAVSITCCVAEVSYVAPTDRDRKMFWRRWQRAAFHFREIN